VTLDVVVVGGNLNGLVAQMLHSIAYGLSLPVLGRGYGHAAIDSTMAYVHHPERVVSECSRPDWESASCLLRASLLVRWWAIGATLFLAMTIVAWRLRRGDAERLQG
jgi:hypothetical protein